MNRTATPKRTSSKRDRELPPPFSPSAILLPRANARNLSGPAVVKMLMARAFRLPHAVVPDEKEEFRNS